MMQMNTDNYSDFTPATEALRYDNLKNNYTYLHQKNMYLPMGQPTGHGGAVFMVSPNRQASMESINSNFAMFYKCGYHVYSTATRYAEKIGSHMVRSNMRSTVRKEFTENRTNKAIRFVNPTELDAQVLQKNLSFVYDIGDWHMYFFNNRYVRGTKFMCQNYIEFLCKRVNEIPIGNYKNKVIYIPANHWFKNNQVLGIRKENLNNPLSIILLCLYKYPDRLRDLINGGYDIIIADEVNGEYLKIKLTSDLTDIKNSRKLYQRLKNQLKKMTCLKVSDDDDDEDINLDASNADDRYELIDSLSKRLTGEPVNANAPKAAPATSTKKAPAPKTSQPKKKEKELNIFNVDDVIGDTSSEYENEMDAEETEETSEDNINSEITNTVASAINTDEDLSNGAYSEEDVEDIVTTRVKREVFINKFVPTRSAEKTAAIEQYAKRQDEVIKQTIPEMKSKLIDITSYDNVVNTHNNNIKESRFANFEKSYNEKKLKPDLVNAVGKLSHADMPLFIEDIAIEDTSDALNQKETYTYTLVDENGKKQKIVLDLPKLINNNYIYVGGNKKMILKQRINRPIVKISPDTVQICTWYNKSMITRHGQAIDSKTVALKKYLTADKHYQKFKVTFGNAKVKNKNYRTSLSFDFLSKNIIEMTVGDARFIFDLPKLEEELKAAKINEPIVLNDQLACGIKTIDGKKSIIRFSVDGKNPVEDKGIEDVIVSFMKPADREALRGISTGKQFAYARMTIMSKKIPVVFFMLFCEGFTKMMSDCNIHYDIYDNTKENRKTDWGEDKGIIECMDKIIIYDKYPYENSLLLSGLRGLPLSSYTYEELDSKDTYIDMIPMFYSNSNMAYNLDQFKNFLLDDASIEMLKDFNQPTELVPLLFYACQLLINNQYVSDVDVSSMRIRSTEVIPQIAYQCIVNAYGKYRKANSTGKGKLSVPRDEVIKALVSSSIMDDASVMNPVMTLEKNHTTTLRASTSVKGITLNGQNKSNGMTMPRRAYDKSMVGVFGITSSANADVGINRFLTIEPNITSTRGYIETSSDDDIEKLNSANLFTFAESLTPPGVRHDDPQRSAMMESQTSHMCMVDDATPVLIGNKVESIVPYHMGGEFCFVAKKPGVIEAVKKGIYIVKYDDGTHDSFDTNPIIHKNSSEGMYTEVQFTCDHEVGYRFQKNEVLAMEKRAFTRDENGLSASMNIGVLAKVAIVSTYDIYEDSEPVTKKLSERLGYWVINMKPVTLNGDTYVERMVKIGDHVNVGDPLIVFDANSGDKEVEDFLAALKGRSDLVDELVESSQTTVKSDESGVIEDIRVYSTMETSQLSPTLQDIVNDYHKRIEAKSHILEKYKNDGDNDFYKCGQLLNETTDVVNASYGKIKGVQVGDGVYIEFYIKHKDIVKKGDKCTNYCALKGVTSHVIPEGQEPFSEFRPDEEISALVAPLGILARKTPSIYVNLFGNKVLIEAKRKLMEDYMKD